jgi:hypothetical protein
MAVSRVVDRGHRRACPDNRGHRMPFYCLMMLVSAFLALAHGMHLWTLSFGDNAAPSTWSVHDINNIAHTVLITSFSIVSGSIISTIFEHILVL